MSLHPLAFFALRVSEQNSHSGHPLALFAVCALAGLSFRLTATVDDPELEKIALQALLDAISEAHLTNKEVCALLKLSKGQWSEICSGQRHTPSHTRLLNLPWAFWSAYLPHLAFLLTKYKVTDLVNERKSA